MPKWTQEDPKRCLLARAAEMFHYSNTLCITEKTWEGRASIEYVYKLKGASRFCTPQEQHHAIDSAPTGKDNISGLPLTKQQGFVEEGVPTGALGPLPSTFQWPIKDTQDLTDLPPLDLCSGNWLAAEQDPDVVADRLQKN